MPYAIELPDELFSKLQKHAIPFIDTPISVIERALVALEAGDEEPTSRRGSPEARTFNPSAPPSLTFTSPQTATVAGLTLPKSETYWNAIMFAVIREAARRGQSTRDIIDLITVNSEPGRREDNGFKYLEEAGLSIQGQDANGAWRQAHVIASSFGIPVEVKFAWQNNPKAAMPNVTGSFFVEGDER